MNSYTSATNISNQAATVPTDSAFAFMFFAVTASALLIPVAVLAVEYFRIKLFEVLRK